MEIVCHAIFMLFLFSLARQLSGAEYGLCMHQFDFFCGGDLIEILI